MNSRLDRLFILLDTGSNESVRLAAAKQLGEVQRIQPNELNYLLLRIKEYSSKSVWETRTAAGQATRYVLEQVGPWPPKSSLPTSEEDKRQCRQEIAEKLIGQHVKLDRIFQQFDLERIMSTCPKLLSLDVSETDETEQVGSTSLKGTTSRGRSRGRIDSASRSLDRKNVKEQLLRQRKLINKELGIAMVDSLNLGVKSTDIVSNDDLQTEYDSRDLSTVATKSSSNLLDSRDIIQQSGSNYDRIIAILYQSNCISELSDNEESVKDNSQPSYACFQWPLTTITKQYADDLFNPSWEIRHGAAIALREIVRLQGKNAGRRSDLSERANDELNQLWLIDMALKALSVLALDKFGDFLFDQVVAPVRENASQFLGCCLAHMSEENAYSIIEIILKMLVNPNWETRHGGILGLKYYLNVINESFSKRILQSCFDPIFKCLADSNDDVSAEAAAALVPVKDLMMKMIPEKAPKLIRFLWDHLAYLDELTTSTSNIVLLLASLITSSSAKLDSVELVRSIPKLWPLLSHSSTSVRISTLKALITLIKSQESSCLSWMPEELMNTALKLVYQRSILENMDDARIYIEEVWMLLLQIEKDSPKTPIERFELLKSTSQCLNFWLCLIMQPSNTPINRTPPMWINIKSDGTISNTKPDADVYIGSCTFNAETINQQKLQVTKCRLLATRLVGALYANLVDDSCEVVDSQHPKETLKYLSDMFIHYSKTKSANQRIISGWALESWASHQIKLFDFDQQKLKTLLPKSLVEQLHLIIQETNLCYDELASTFTRLQQETRNFVAALGEASIDSSSLASTDKRAIYTLNQIQTLCDIDLEKELNRTLKKRACVSNSVAKLEQNDVIRSETYTLLYNKKANLTKSLKITHSSQKTLSTSVLSSLSCALISWLNIPEQMKFIVQPLLDSIEFEEEQALQDKSINYLVTLFDVLTKDSDKDKGLLDYILTRLVEVSSCRALASINDNEENATNSLNSPHCSIDLVKRNGIDTHRIVLLDNLQRRANLSRSIPRRQSSINSTSSLKRSHSLTSSLDLESDAIVGQDECSRTQNNAFSESKDNIRVRGASLTLSKLAEHFAMDLPQKLPLFWETITTTINSEVETFKKSNIDVDEIKLIKSLILLGIVGDSLHVDLRNCFLDLYPNLILLLTSSNSMIRHHSSQCIGIISKLMLNETIGLMSKSILPMLEREDNTLARCGSIESIALIIEHLQLDLVSRINMFIIHVLRRMSDQNDQIRLMATHCFGKLLSLMPLNLEESKDAGDRYPKPLTENIKQDDERFIEQLLDQKKLDNFIIPFEMKVGLRTYQQEGLNWLAFLNRFNLHGILCDEMGLGKTFMTICMVASEHFEVKNENEQVCSSCPSLIVCPSTLTEHWLYEIAKFLPIDLQSILNPVAYTGALNDRMNLRTRILNGINKSKDKSTNKSSDRKHSNEQAINLVVVSYDIVRNDLDFFREVHWNYCVLDEGHIIKNGKTKLSRAIRLITAKHRLILSGTPIQNNVTELWSLFDFLMPGFLGSDRQFNARYAKPILQSREPKCSARELEAGALAMESLHRQVLPFILRRLKEDVLDDLPPKIIQDYYCELSPLQHKLYEDFTRSSLCKDVTKKSLHHLHDEADESTIETKSNSKSHVFQALQYLKNVCNHPKLVLTDKHSQYTEIKRSLSNEKSCLDDITHSSKLRALKQLLIDCGIGVMNQLGDEQQPSIALESVVNQHRALIFCQIRSMVEIIENDLLKKHLPSITYLKLDGSIPPNQRHSIVSRFNNDPSIDILLLTTQIGGLGLNLTGADTVIFVEHDWNPTKDLQAMDRAHRIGQKKVVNVYRLITKGTLEEKIMGLQKFKTMVSNTVINQDNAGLRTMNVDQLFDLFEDTASDKGYANSCSKQIDSGSKSKSSFIDLLPELWDQQQYETEYDLSNFVSSLKN